MSLSDKLDEIPVLSLVDTSEWRTLLKGPGYPWDITGRFTAAIDGLLFYMLTTLRQLLLDPSRRFTTLDRDAWRGHVRLLLAAFTEINTCGCQCHATQPNWLVDSSTTGPVTPGGVAR